MRRLKLDPPVSFTWAEYAFQIPNNGVPVTFIRAAEYEAKGLPDSITFRNIANGLSDYMATKSVGK